MYTEYHGRQSQHDARAVSCSCGSPSAAKEGEEVKMDPMLIAENFPGPPDIHTDLQEGQ